MQSELSLPENWAWAPLAALTGVNPVTYGVVQPGADVASGVPMVRVNNFSSHRLKLGSVMRISEEIESKYRRTRLRPNDVLITIVGSVGQVAVVPPELLGWNIARAVALIRPEDPGLSRWLSFCLRSPFSQRQLGLSANTTVQTTINLKDLRQLPIPMPPSSERDAITEILSALEDRIDCLNDEMMSLESIASAIFKSWFIDFDPVRAKAEGREPEGMSADTAALFPGEFVDSELGPIPKGWTVACLKDHVAVDRGLSYKGNGLCGPGEGIPMHNLNSIYEGGGYKYEGIKYYRGDYKERHLVGAGDLIVTNTEQGHEHRLIGFPGVVPSRFTRGLYSHHLYKVVPRSGMTVGREFIYHLLRDPAVRDQVIGCANGSTVNMLKIEGLQIPRFVCPTEESSRVFEGISSEIRRKVECNFGQSEALMGLRDTLLPRLLSGILSV